ncbi:hypothetical protein [Streptacidiphilus sp. EB103A]|uniref:hypothetical protein n=1 Tax=Streptacidiphilus sp. EB103A TaxID=3156275 RepID=UPI0035182134
MPAESPSMAPADVLRAARQRDSTTKRSRTLKTVKDILKDGQPITFAAVARRAEVSTWLVYATGVREHIDKARARQAAEPAQETRTGLRASTASAHTDLLLARKQLRTEVTHLRDGMRLHLGQQLDQLSSRDLTARLSELTEENLRLSAAERTASAQNTQLSRQVAALEDELAAARTSLRRMIRKREPAPAGTLSITVQRLWNHSRMEFELAPPTGIGALTIGMPREAADQALASFRDPSAISESDQPGRFVFRPSGLMISTHCSRGELEAIELGRPADGQDSVRFRGIDVFSLPAAEVVTRLREVTTITDAEDDPASFVAPDLLLSFWRPFEADDAPDEEQGYYFSSVLLARPGYYDTPTEAAARLRTAGHQEA